jgi:hypothetical protein
MGDALCLIGRVLAGAVGGGLGGQASAVLFYALDGVNEWYACMLNVYLEFGILLHRGLCLKKTP